VRRPTQPQQRLRAEHPGGASVAGVIVDCDQHLFEPADMWMRYCDPADRDLALRMVTDDLGYVWIAHRGRQLLLAEPHQPGQVTSIGDYRQRWKRGERSDLDYPAFAASYSDPAAIIGHLDDAGLDATVLFPNYGIGWERPLAADLPSTLANMAAWNRWITEIASEGAGRLYPVGHLCLRDLAWLEQQLAWLEQGGIRLALIPPALVDGKPLSHPDLDRAWSAFVDHGITPVFHVANQPRPFDDAWYGDDIPGGVSPLSSVFLWTGVALALTDLILGGVLERHPDLRLGVMELSAIWVPLHLQMLDGGYRFAATFNGEAAPLSLRPSDYFRRQVRVAAFSYEMPQRLMARAGDIFMACSDYPHTEGTSTPLEDYRSAGADPDAFPGLFNANIAYLLRAITDT
jgi:predicted TIM-barrel fold metal-dependent hydrolase